MYTLCNIIYLSGFEANYYGCNSGTPWLRVTIIKYIKNSSVHLYLLYNISRKFELMDN